MNASRPVPFITCVVTAPACDVKVACRRLAGRSNAVGDLPVTTSVATAAAVLSTVNRTVMVSSRKGVKLAAQVLSDWRMSGPKGMLPPRFPAKPHSSSSQGSEVHQLHVGYAMQCLVAWMLTLVTKACMRSSGLKTYHIKTAAYLLLSPLHCQQLSQATLCWTAASPQQTGYCQQLLARLALC